MVGKVAVSRAACVTAPGALRPIPSAYLGTVDAATTGRHVKQGVSVRVIKGSVS